MRSDGECVEHRGPVRAVEDVALDHGSVDFLPGAIPEDPEVASGKDVDHVVIDNVIAALVLPCAGIGAVDDVLFLSGPALPVVRAQTAAHPLVGEDVVDIVAPDQIALARARDVDPCSVAEFLQHALHFVVLDDISWSSAD